MSINSKISIISFFAIAILALCVDTFSTTPQSSPPWGDATALTVAGRAGPTSARVVSGLTEHEVAHMRYMREEEKLAHDVYFAMVNLWGAPVFGRISQSELRHTDVIGRLLAAYSVPDPSLHRGQGEFEDKKLSALYATLIKKASQSVEQALLVGGLIEEVDIADLEQAVASTSKPDIIRVYTNIHRGSRNHLRQFAGSLQQMGVAYAPQKLPAAEVQGILTTPMENAPPL